MADFPYSPHAASAKRFLDHVQKAGVPEKVTQKYLEKVGFKSKNDRYILGILKFLGFVDSTGVPTETWRAYRNKESAGAVLAAAMRKAYGDLFRTYPDAHRKDSEALRNYFSARTTVAESTLGLIVNTFKTLAGAADFESAVPVAADKSATGEAIPADNTAKVRRDVAGDDRAPAEPAININIQLQLPATDDGAIYDKLFAALKKHLFS
jgi:hypothetical protein